jgi:hypothetical protein
LSFLVLTNSGNEPLTDDFVILRMRSNPYPEDAAFDFGSKGTVAIADPDGPKASDALEVKRWVAGVGLEKTVILVGESADFFRKGFMQRPKAR